MSSQRFLYFLMLILATLLLALQVFAAPAASAEDLPNEIPDEIPDEIIVTGIGIGSGQDDEAGNIASLDWNEIALIHASHPSQILNRLPGFNIQQGSGQEHLTAIRSPVLTGGAGAGSFLYLEDGVALRAPGFANVNGLFEAMTEFAASIETVRGPGSALYGSNAVHGTINVKSRQAEAIYEGDLSLRFGADPFLTHLITSASAPVSPDAGLRLGFAYLLDNGWRSSSGIQSFKGQMRYDHDFGTIKLKTLLSAHGLNQQTASYVEGPNAYKDKTAIFNNEDPDAYRKAQAVRGQAQIEWTKNKNNKATLTTWFRWTNMDFLMHFFPTTPVEKNHHASFGIRPIWHHNLRAFHKRFNFAFGGELEWTKGALSQIQDAMTRQGFSGNIIDEFPQGVHYDYEIDALTFALFTQNKRRLNDQRTDIHFGLRAEYTRYDYDNLTDDGDFGRFQRPPDGQDDFLTLTPKIGINYRLPQIYDQRVYIFANYTIGSRAPQTTDLYRLHKNQTDNDIKAERLESFELGLRGRRRGFFWELTGFYMNKSRHNFRDAAFETVANGKTRHAGIELQAQIPLIAGLSWQTAFTYARHEYAFNHPPSSIKKGDDVDSAPRILLNTKLAYTHDYGRAALELVHVGKYYTDPANAHDYAGHEVLNLRSALHIGRDLSLFFNILNLADARYADRADFAFGNDRYFPGQPRSFYLGIKNKF